MFSARDIHLWRGERHLLKGVSFEVRKSEFLQLVGPNGVGKTSLLRACCGLLPVEAGEFLWGGQAIDTVRNDFNRQVAYLAHTNALKADLTAAENLRYELALRRATSSAAITETLNTVGIVHCAELPARALSAGQRRRLGFARILMCDALLWILDEPTTNLDSDGMAVVERLMIQHLLVGGSILAAAHHGLLAGHANARTLELHS